MGSFSKCADSNFKIPDPGDPNQAHFWLAFSIGHNAWGETTLSS